MHGFKVALATVIKEECIDDWLNAPSTACGGRKPIELAKAGEWETLNSIVYYLIAGIPS